MNIAKTIAYGLLLSTIAQAAACGGTGEQTVTAPEDAGASDENIAPEEPAGEFPGDAQVQPAPTAEETPEMEASQNGFAPVFIEKPAVIESAPHDGEKNVGPTAIIRVTFNHAMNPESVQGRFQVKIFAVFGWFDVEGTVTTLDDTTYVFTPSAPLKENALYGILVEKAAKDKAGTAMTADFKAGFQTAL